MKRSGYCPPSWLALALAICGAPTLAQDCRVALDYLRLEAAGDFQKSDELLLLPQELHQFRTRPAFRSGEKTDSLSGTEKKLSEALGVLVKFELAACTSSWIGLVATIRVSLPDFHSIFPGRTGGIAITIPKTESARKDSEEFLEKQYKSIAALPLVVTELTVPLIQVGNTTKVGLPK